MKPTVILYFIDGLEAEASKKSALDIKDSLSGAASLLPLSRENWVDPIRSLDPTTLCFLATHGDIGENGTLQSFLESHSLRHTHSDATTSALLTDKHATKLIYTALDIPTPSWKNMGTQFGEPVPHVSFLEKPRFGGSKRGIKHANSHNANNNPEILYEEVIEGSYEISIPVLRDKDAHIALSPIVRQRTTSDLGNLEDANDSALKPEILQYCQHQAARLSRALNCYGVTKTDFVINEKGDAFAIETDAIPGLCRTNATSLAANKAGITYDQLLKKIMETTTQ